MHVSVPEILVHRRKASNRTIIGGLERRDDRRARRLLQTAEARRVRTLGAPEPNEVKI